MESQSLDSLLKEKQDDWEKLNEIFKDRISDYEVTINDLKLRLLPTVTLQRVED